MNPFSRGPAHDWGRADLIFWGNLRELNSTQHSFYLKVISLNVLLAFSHNRQATVRYTALRS